eukprot:scaffold19167_cov111-Isochrysis_galbana.AAC.1
MQPTCSPALICVPAARPRPSTLVALVVRTLNTTQHILDKNFAAAPACFRFTRGSDLEAGSDTSAISQPRHTCKDMTQTRHVPIYSNTSLPVSLPGQEARPSGNGAHNNSWRRRAGLGRRR